MLRQAIAAALQHVRQKQQVLLTDFDEGVSSVHTSRVERAKSGVTIEKLDSIARELGVHPLTVLALAYGAQESVVPTDLLERISNEVTSLGGSFAALPIDQSERVHGRVAAAQRRRDDVQRLKAKGMTMAEAAEELGIARQTVWRHW
ncbi:transcriptional regulator [Pseudomonas sp. Irchel s3f19]|uniref:transcriptional regulator n=1 Tax=Pseudomonas sp. Irchel s3f19 TaxID=2009146 RepID=UPI000BA3DE62|nr:transcriptional regulator [Pseudomonas sp. Irchel s3f19]